MLDVIFPMFFTVFLLGLLGLVGIGMVDGVQSLRAREATFACEAKNLEAVRLTFGTKVVCRARNLGSDTLVTKQAN